MADESSTPERQSPAGRYPDPEVEGGQRFWNGVEWTDQRRLDALKTGRVPRSELRGSRIVTGFKVIAGDRLLGTVEREFKTGLKRWLAYDASGNLVGGYRWSKDGAVKALAEDYAASHSIGA